MNKVGIFMPCYNMGRYIDEGLESLYGQTFQDFNVIIADDASTQKSTLEKLSNTKRPRCQIFYEKNNIGLIKISNKYLAKLETEYILLFSPDDRMDPSFLEAQVAYLDSHPNIAAVSTWVQEFGEGDNLIKYDDKTCKLPHMLIDNYFSGAALIRKSAWLEVGMYDTNKNLYPNLDYVLWLAMLEKGFLLGTIPKPLFYWRVVRDSLSHRMDAKKMLVFRKGLLKRFLPLYREYADYVMSNNLEVISNFENYYAINEEGHTWLDDQYKKLTNANAELNNENAKLVSRLNKSIEKPYWRSIIYKLKKHLKP